METLASNYRMALEAKDKIIEERDREIEALKQVISRLESERLTDDRDRTESHIQSDQLKASLATALTDRYTDSTFTYDGLDSQDVFEYASLRRSRRKRRPKRVGLSLATCCRSSDQLLTSYHLFYSRSISLK